MKLGSEKVEGGVRFSVFSSVAKLVELCLFEFSAGAWKETIRLPMECGEGWIWTRIVKDVSENTAYAYRVTGPWDPFEGHYCNPKKILLDPYARAIAREPIWHDSLLGLAGSLMSEEDSGEYGPLGAILPESTFDWGKDKRPEVPWEKTIIYEAHVKGLTQLYQKVPQALRGTYRGMSSEPVLDHLRKLGITSVELLPVHQAFDEAHVHARGMTNFWGYNTLSYFSPSMRYASGKSPAAVLDDFRTMVKEFHQAGIEVFLDVVYNHTCEGNETGPVLSLRGLDNAHYYRTVPENRALYEDFTGCGNTVDVRNPMALQLVLDSLRYWVREMHIDGFRFDLTSALIHGETNVDLKAPFLLAVQQDPELSKVKLIAEPWDCSFGGYMVGRFPAPWRDWNGQFRDSARAFWRGDERQIGGLASRLSGSSDFFAGSGRKATASINFITAHDGFTLRDVVSYSEKHNLSNGEDNRDGENNNFSFNCGEEGETENTEIRLKREQQRRNLIATLLLSHGVPMMLAGDELSRTQHGNNNPYCQDNELSWVSWELNESAESFLEFVRSLIRIRAQYPLLSGTEFFSGEVMPGSGRKDVTWLGVDAELAGERWGDPNTKTLGMWIVSKENAGEGLLLLLNAADKGVDFSIPTSTSWEILMDTSSGLAKSSPPFERHEASYFPLPAHTFVILKQASSR